MQVLFLFLGVSGALAGTVEVGWDPIVGAQEYRVHWSTTSNVTIGSVPVVVPASACAQLTTATVSCGDTVGAVQCRASVPAPDNAPVWVSVRACKAGGVSCSALTPLLPGGGWPRPAPTDVTYDAAGKITGVVGNNFKAGATVKVDSTTATVTSITPTKISIAPIAGFQIDVRNSAEEVGGCAPFGRLSVTLGAVTGRGRTDDRTAP